jgi:hypothetical protein
MALTLIIFELQQWPYIKFPLLPFSFESSIILLRLIHSRFFITLFVQLSLRILLWWMFWYYHYWIHAAIHCTMSSSTRPCRHLSYHAIIYCIMLLLLIVSMIVCHAFCSIVSLYTTLTAVWMPSLLNHTAIYCTLLPFTVPCHHLLHDTFLADCFYDCLSRCFFNCLFEYYFNGCLDASITESYRHCHHLLYHVTIY